MSRLYSRIRTGAMHACLVVSLVVFSPSASGDAMTQPPQQPLPTGNLPQARE